MSSAHRIAQVAYVGAWAFVGLFAALAGGIAIGAVAYVVGGPILK